MDLQPALSKDMCNASSDGLAIQRHHHAVSQSSYLGRDKARGTAWPSKWLVICWPSELSLVEKFGYISNGPIFLGRVRFLHERVLQRAILCKADIG